MAAPLIISAIFHQNILKPAHASCFDHFQFTLTDLFLLLLRVLLVRGESRDLLEVLDSRVFQDPRVLLVRLASLESR